MTCNTLSYTFVNPCEKGSRKCFRMLQACIQENRGFLHGFKKSVSLCMDSKNRDFMHGFRKVMALCMYLEKSWFYASIQGNLVSGMNLEKLWLHA